MLAQHHATISSQKGQQAAVDGRQWRTTQAKRLLKRRPARFCYKSAHGCRLGLETLQPAAEREVEEEPNDEGLGPEREHCGELGVRRQKSSVEG